MVLQYLPTSLGHIFGVFMLANIPAPWFASGIYLPYIYHIFTIYLAYICSFSCVPLQERYFFAIGTSMAAPLLDFNPDSSRKNEANQLAVEKIRVKLGRPRMSLGGEAAS